jgi:hypothetical protein
MRNLRSFRMWEGPSGLVAAKAAPNKFTVIVGADPDPPIGYPYCREAW